MHRVETLLTKLQQQFNDRAEAGELLLTVQMLQAELLHMENNSPSKTCVSIDIPNFLTENNIIPKNTDKKTETEPEKIIEVLQVDEAAIEAELEELKRNAETLTKISLQNKPHILFEDDEELPTLAQRDYRSTSQKEINETVAVAATSLNDKLKLSQNEISELLTETPVRDLKKAIGVNDRFLFINELFRGDEAMYERSIRTINNFTILPEAEYWIQRELKVKIGWDEGSETVKHFNQLVKRRFS